MRLLLLTEYFAPHVGGGAVYYYEVMRRVRGMDVIVVARAHPGAAAFDCRQPFVIVRTPFPQIPKVRMMVELGAQFLAALRLTKKRPVSVLHGGQVYPLGLAACAIHLLTGIPYVLYVHGEEIAVAGRRRWISPMVTLVLRHAAVVFVNSWFSATQVSALGVSALKIHVARPGVDPNRFRPTDGSALRTRLGGEGRRVLLSVGHLVPRKGQDTVIRLLPRIAAIVPDVVYWIAGTGVKAERQRLKDLAAAAGVADRVRFLGEFPDEHLAELYAACDVFVMLNRTMPDGDVEGFGMVFLEANACGKPVVGGRSGGAVEAVRDGQTGFLVREGDDGAAVASIVRLLGDPDLRARLGETGRRRAIKHFEWDRTARRVARITAGLVQSSGAGSDVTARKDRRARLMVSTTEIPNIITLAKGIVQWLVSTQQTDGNLRDPVTGAALPSDHYGTALFAATGTLAEHMRGATDAAASAVRYYLGLPRSARGSHELNNLGLLCVYRCWRDSSVAPSLRTRLGTYLQRMPFASLTSQVTNNWHAMRAVCLAQRGRLFGSERDRRAARVCLRKDVLPLQGSDGLFADYPPVGREGDRMTPLTYHAKFCAMLAMFLQEIDDTDVADALARGVGVMARLCAPNGESLFFGRGCNSVYGYASALYAACHALELGIIPTADRNLVVHAAARMADFLLRMRQPDGSVRAYPTGFEAERLGWDDYVHRLDYNAFAAFLLLQMPVNGVRTESTHDPSGLDARQDGLLVRELNGAFAVFSVRGQLNTGSYLFADARYAGMQPLTLQCGGRTIIPPPPHDAESPTDPSWVGFMPVISLHDEMWAVRTYDDVRVIDTNFVAIVGRGTPVALRIGLRRRLTKAARESAGLPIRAFVRRAAPFLRRLHGLTPPAYAVVPTPGVQVKRAMILTPRLRCLCLVERVDGQFDRGWSTVRLAGRCSPDGDGYRFCLEGLEGRIWTARPPGDGEVRQVFTSNGPAYVLRTPLVPGVAHVSAICFGPKVALDAEINPGKQITITARADGAIHRIVVDLDALQVAHG